MVENHLSELGSLFEFLNPGMLGRSSRLLDPWWNPAVEAQAVDRAHRIGQDRPVIAYRLIAKDTVEEKILKLQETKRDLAEAVLSESGRALGKLSGEDLELLLG